MIFWPAPAYNNSPPTIINRNILPATAPEAELIRELKLFTPSDDKIFAKNEIIIPEQFYHPFSSECTENRRSPFYSKKLRAFPPEFIDERYLPFQKLRPHTRIVSEVEDAIKFISQCSVPYFRYDKEEEKRRLFCDTAEAILTMNCSSKEFCLRFFGTDPQKPICSVDCTYCCINPYNPYDHISRSFEGYIFLKDLWGLRFFDNEIQYSSKDALGNSIILTKYKVHEKINNIRDYWYPYLSIAANFFRLNDLYDTALKICADMSVNPYTEIKDLSLLYNPNSSTNDVALSYLVNQYAPHDQYISIETTDTNGLTKYEILCHFPDMDRFFAHPIRYLCKRGHAYSVPYILSPENHYFIGGKGIEQKGEILIITPHVAYTLIGELSGCTIISAWNLKENLERLPWKVFKGKTVHYLLTYQESINSAELDLALAVCEKIKKVGYTQPKIVEFNAEICYNEGCSIYNDNEFAEILEKHSQKVDLRGFPDYRLKTDIPIAKETGFDYILTSCLYIVLGEEKAGKTWLLLYYLLEIAYSCKTPGTVIYFYGEDVDYRIKENIKFLKKVLKYSETRKGHIECVNLAQAPCVQPGGFDMKDPVCQEFIFGKIAEVKKKNKLPIVAVGLDNYSHLMGLDRDGTKPASIALDFCGKLQERNLAVFLACHTNTKGEIASSIQIGRTASGIIRISKEVAWQEKKFNSLMSELTPQQRQNLTNQKKLDKLERKYAKNKFEAYVSFERWRDIEPLPFGLILNTKANEEEIIIEPDSLEKENAYEKYLMTIAEGSGKKKKTKPTKETPGLTLKEIDKMQPEERIKTLRERVAQHNFETRAELAEHFGCGRSSINKHLKKWELFNADIKLKPNRGRRKIAQIN